MIRRHKQIRITPEMLLAMLKNEVRYQIDGIPPSAEITRAGYDLQTDVFYITVTDESFEELKDYQFIPPLHPTVKTV